MCFLLLLFLLAGSRICLAQNSETDSLKKIKINVVDSLSLVPIEGCWLVVTDSTQKQLFSGLSDKNGVINLAISMKRSNIFIFQANSFKSKTRKLDFSKREMATIGLSSSTNQLKEVTILGSTVSRDADKLRYQVNSSKFEKGSDALVVLQDVPLVQVSGNDEVSIKNGVATVLVNGRPMPNQLLRTIKAENISSIDVLTNPSSSTSAEGNSAGIVNIRLKEKDIPQLNGNVLFVGGLIRHMFFPGFALNANSKKVYTSINLSYQSISQESFANTKITSSSGDALSTQSNQSENTYNAANYSWDIYYNPTKSTQISLSANHSRTDIESLSIGNDIFINTNTRFDNHNLYHHPANSTGINLEYNRKNLNGGSLIFSYGFQNRNNKIVSDFFTSSPSSGASKALFDSNLEKRLNSIQVVWKTSLFKNKVTTESGVLVSNSKSTNINRSLTIASPDPVFDDIKLTQNTISLFTTLRYGLGKFDFRAGGRLENLEQTYRSSVVGYKQAYHNFFPNAVIKTNISKSFDLLFNYQRRVSRPDISLLNPAILQFSNIETYRGNTELVPEFQNRYDLNLDYKRKNSFYEFTLYVNHTKDQLLYLLNRNGNTLEYNYLNVNDLFQFGLSLSSKFNLTKTLTINSTLFTESYAYEDQLDRSTRPNGHDYGGKVNLYWHLPKWFSISNAISYRHLLNFGYQNYQVGYPIYSFSLSKIFLKNKLFTGLTIKDIFETQSRSRTYIHDLNFKQYRFANSGTRDISIQLSYSFGKTFYSGKSQTNLQSSEEKTFKKQ